MHEALAVGRVERGGGFRVLSRPRTLHTRVFDPGQTSGFPISVIPFALMPLRTPE